MSSRNIKLILEFDGAGFHGWQKQPEMRTVQGVLEHAVSEIFGQQCEVNGAGRTDAGVHALGYVCNFVVESNMEIVRVPLALMAASKSIVVNALPRAYIYFFRGTPLIVQMFMIYHGMGQFEGLRESFLWPVFKEAYWCALIAFSLNTAGYTA